MQTTQRAQQVITDLFATYQQTPQRMPPEFAQRAHQASAAAEQARVVADFIAGMTDRYALAEHAQITGYRIMQEP